MKSIISVFASIALLSSCCSIKLDYVSEIVYRNTTEHTIEIWFGRSAGVNFPVGYILLEPLGEYGYSHSYKHFAVPLSEKTVILYDGLYANIQTLTGDYMENNICGEESYEFETVGKKTRRYTYTFTEEDYNRAVSGAE